MKSSRIRGAALAWGAILASGTTYAQYPYPVSYNPYGLPQQYSAQTMGQPQSMPRAIHLPPTSASGFHTPSNNPALPGTMPNMAMGGQFTGPIQYSQVSHYNPGNGASVLAPPTQAPPLGTGALGTPGGTGPGSTLFAPGAPQGSAEEVYGYPPSGALGAGMGGAYGTGAGVSPYAGGMGAGVGSMGCVGAGAGYDTGAFGYGAGSCAPPPRMPSWYVGAYGLWFTLDTRDHYTFSFDTANESVQLTDARDASMNWDGGFAIAAGHYFNCGANALEFIYWGWYPDDVNVYTYDTQVAGNLNGIHNWNSLTYNGVNAATLVDNARVHALFHQTEVHNVEINLLQFGNAGAAASMYTPWQYSFIAGARHFRFDDRLAFGSDTTDNVFDGDLTEIFYDIQTVNRLWGFQVGGLATYCASPRFSFNGGTKLGLFVNDISLNSSIGGPAGLAVINNGPFTGQEWIVRTNKQDMSFLGELFVGGSYCLTPRLSLSAGYRAVAITGLALPTDQIYADLRGINDVNSIESNSSAILHGAYFGAQYCF